MRRETRKIVKGKSVDDHNVLPVTSSFKCKGKWDLTIRKFKAIYCVSGDVQNRMSPEPPNSYSPVVQWDTVILQCIIGFQSQSFDFTNAFYQVDIPSGELVFIETPRYFSRDAGQCDVVLRLNKILYDQAEAACLWYEK